MIFLLDVRFANALRRPLLFWNEKNEEKQLPKVAPWAQRSSSNMMYIDVVLRKMVAAYGKSNFD